MTLFFESESTMKYLTPLAAFLTLAIIAGDCSAEPPGRGQRGQRGKGENGQRKEGRGLKGQGQRPGPGGDRDPAKMVARMMKEFDKDGDSKLNLRELTAMMTTMRERREGGGQRGLGQKPGGSRRGGAKGKKGAAAGGDKPKRPAAE